MEIIYKKLKDLKEYKNNNKKHPKEQVERMKKSIKAYGFNVPFIIDKENNIIAGHGRKLACNELDIKEVPCIIKENLTKADIKALRIMDNKSAESEFDYDALNIEFQELGDLDYDLSLTGFNIDEINEIKTDVSMDEAFDNLPEGDKADFEQMTFILHQEQAIEIKNILEIGKKDELLNSAKILNSNSNGSTLWVCLQRYKEWAEQNK